MRNPAANERPIWLGTNIRGGLKYDGASPFHRDSDGSVVTQLQANVASQRERRWNAKGKNGNASHARDSAAASRAEGAGAQGGSCQRVSPGNCDHRRERVDLGALYTEIQNHKNQTVRLVREEHPAGPRPVGAIEKKIMRTLTGDRVRARLALPHQTVGKKAASSRAKSATSFMRGASVPFAPAAGRSPAAVPAWPGGYWYSRYPGKISLRWDSPSAMTGRNHSTKMPMIAISTSPCLDDRPSPVPHKKLPTQSGFRIWPYGPATSSCAGALLYDSPPPG